MWHNKLLAFNSWNCHRRIFEGSNLHVLQSLHIFSYVCVMRLIFIEGRGVLCTTWDAIISVKVSSCHERIYSSIIGTLFQKFYLPDALIIRRRFIRPKTKWWKAGAVGCGRWHGPNCLLACWAEKAHSRRIPSQKLPLEAAFGQERLDSLLSDRRLAPISHWFGPLI